MLTSGLPRLLTHLRTTLSPVHFNTTLAKYLHTPSVCIQSAILFQASKVN